MATTTTTTDGAEYNGIEIGQGFDCDFAFQVVDKPTGLPVDLTGYTAKITLRLGFKEAVALTASSAVVADSYCTIGGTNGKVNVHLDHVDTVNLVAPKFYVFDVRLISAGGASETRPLFGTMYVRPQVTASV